MQVKIFLGKSLRKLTFGRLRKIKDNIKKRSVYVFARDKEVI
jgi:hypothetical protein